jgi:twitching motility two-component system response regulator PilH
MCPNPSLIFFNAEHSIKIEVESLNLYLTQSDKISMKIDKMPRLKVLIADGDARSKKLAEFLTVYGFSCQFVEDGHSARTIMLQWNPDFVVADMMLPGMTAMELVKVIGNEPKLTNTTRLVVMSGHAKNASIKQCLLQGAVDFIVKPVREPDLLKRLVFLSRTAQRPQNPEESPKATTDEGVLLLHLTELLLRQSQINTPAADKLFRLTQMLGMKMDAVRCSVVQCLNPQTGIVVTSNDNKDATGIPLDFTKYPEIVHVMNTETIVAIESIDANKHLKSIKNLLKGISFSSMIVGPIRRRDQFFGVLSVRMKSEKKSFSENEIRFIQIASHIMGIVLSEAQTKNQQDFWKIAS